MNKNQQMYVFLKLRNAADAAKRKWDDANPCSHTEEEKLARLKKAGFITDGMSKYGLVNLKLPLTAQHKKNLAKREQVYDQINRIESDARDQVMLADLGADAIKIIANFTDALAKVK